MALRAAAWPVRSAGTAGGGPRARVMPADAPSRSRHDCAGRVVRTQLPEDARGDVEHPAAADDAAVRHERVHDPPRPGFAALMVAVLSIAAKEGLYRYTIGRGRAINSSAVIANAWHHRSDAFSSIGTVIGIAGAMFLGESWRILDPLAAIAISLFIVRAGVGIMRDSFDELLEKSLDKEMEHKILEAINEVSGALKPHRLRTRKVGRVIAMDVHVKVDAALNIVAAHEIATRVESRIRELLGAETIISVHIEPDD